MDSLLLSNLLKHLSTERFECEVSVVAQLQEIRLEEVAIEATKSTVVAAAGIAGIAMVSNPVQTMVVVKAATEILEPFSALGSPRN